MSEALLNSTEKIAKYIDANGSFLDELITTTKAAAILQEAGRLAGTAPLAEEHLRQAKIAYQKAVGFAEDD